MKRLAFVAAVLIAASGAVSAQGMGGGPGPGPVPSPWGVNGSTLYYDQGSVLLPSTVPGGACGAGCLNVNTLKVQGKALVLGGNLTTVGNFPASFSFTGSTSVTFPTSGTLATVATANVASVTNSDGTLTISPTTGSVIASLALGHTNSWTGNQYFASGRPWADIRAAPFGAVGNGLTDDTGAVQNAINFLVTNFGGGTLYIPPSNAPYCLKGGVTVPTGASIRIIGASTLNPELSACGVDVTPVTMQGQYSSIEFVTIAGKGTNDTGTFGATQSALIFGTTCVNCRFLHSFAVGGLHAIELRTDDIFLEDSFATQAYGSSMIYGVAGDWFRRVKADQSWPVSIPVTGSTITAWAATTTYAVGAVVSTQGYHLQASTGGTSGSSAPTLKNYGQNITDGSVVWQLAKPLTYYAIQLDTGASENTIDATDMTGSFTAGLALTNTLAGRAPQFTKLTDSAANGNPTTAGILATDGHGLEISGLHTAGGFLAGGGGIVFQNNWTGDVSITNSFFWASSYGVVIGAGKNFSLTTNNFAGNTTACIAALSVTDFTITGNILGNSTSFGACTLGAQVTGSSDFYNITGNITDGATTPISDGGSGTHKNVSGNNAPIPSTVSPPIVLSGAGNLSCPTCATSSGGGAVTGTSPISVSGAGVVSIATATNTALGAASGDNATLSVSGGGAFSLALNHANTWTAAQTFPANSLTLSELPQGGAKAILGNATAGTANITSTGYTASSLDGTLAAVHGAITSGNLQKSFDAAGTIADAGVSLGAGTSGGVPYYSAAGVLSSSAALTANALVLGGGAGAAPTTTATLPAANFCGANPASGYAQPINLQINASVGSNILTVAVVGTNGSAPSATNPICLPFRDVTAANGDPAWVSITSALSVTTNATGATLGSSSTVPFRFWVVAFNNAGTVVLGLINASTPTQIFPLNEGAVQSTTAMSASATSAGVFYTPNGTTLTSKAFRIIGYLEYASGLTTAGTYATAPTTVQLFGPGVPRPGSILQTSYTPISSGFACTTCTAYTATTLTASITPSASMNLISVEVSGTANTSVASSYCSVVLRRGTSTNISPQYILEASVATLLETGLTAKALDLPGVASSTAYAAYLLTQTNGNSCGYPASTIGTPYGNVILTEIMG